MALTISLSTEQTGVGVPAPNAYIKIGGMNFSDGSNAAFGVQWYFDQTARATLGVRPLKSEEFFMTSFDHTLVQSPKTQLYTYLKTLPAFAGAQDVL